MPYIKLSSLSGSSNEVRYPVTRYGEDIEVVSTIERDEIRSRLPSKASIPNIIISLNYLEAVSCVL